MTIGEALKSLRMQQGLTQTEMAAGLVTESFYSKVERGKHKIDAETLIDILTIHHYDVVNFFSKIANQEKKETNPFFELNSKIVFAQNNKDIDELNKISAEIERKKIKLPIRLQIRLEEAYAWILHSNEHASPRLKRRVKTLMSKSDWDRFSYTFLGQAVILMDIDDAYAAVNSAFRAYSKNPQTDTFTLQSLGYIGVNFLNCCFHQKGNKEYAEQVIKFLLKLPTDPSIGIEKIIANYYQALFNCDEDKKRLYIRVLKESGYYSIIKDTVK